MNDIEFVGGEPLPSAPARVSRARHDLDVRLLLSCIACSVVVASMWLPQLSIVFPHADVYQVNGWGQYSISRHFHGDSQFSISGSAPALGAAAFVAALITVFTVAAHVLGRITRLVANKVVLTAGGAIAGSCACQIVELHNFGPYEHWRWGLSIFTVGAALALCASLWPASQPRQRSGDKRAG